MKLGIILGTRPEIIKMAPVIEECAKRGLPFFILHTNQHYSSSLSEVFLRELHLPKPHYNLRVGPGTHAQEVARMLEGIEKVLIKETPDVILVQGDTNTVLAGALVASKLGIKIGHIEAGLRSYNRRMPEEINRIAVDHLADYLFAPTKDAANILLREGIPRKKLYVTGNTIVDVVRRYSTHAEKESDILERLHLLRNAYFLVTLHRPENVDEEKRIRGILDALGYVHKKFNLPLLFPLHPRTRKQLRRFGLGLPYGVRAITPVGFLDFLKLEYNAKLVLTDSGGVQEETCVLGVPCVTLRDDTERPETLEVGSNILAGTRRANIVNAVTYMMKRSSRWRNPLGDGKAAERIITIFR